MSLKAEDALTILKMIPAIIAAVKTLEDLINVSDAGKLKLNLVMDTANDLFGDIVSSWGTIQPILEKFIGGLVKLANVTGVFKSKTPAN
jgi:hypothetical protein